MVSIRQPIVHFTPLNYNHRLNDIYSYYYMSKFNSEWNYDHWLVHLKHPKCKLRGFDVIDYCIRLLATIIGSENDARNKVYAIWSMVPFGFGAEIDKKTSTKLKALQDVLVVLPDYSFDAKHKGGIVLYVARPRPGKLYSNCNYVFDDRHIYSDEEPDIYSEEDSDDVEESVNESVDQTHYTDLATWKKDPRKYCV
ncbi:hypothetical protein IFM89_018531 [Coptis chinensis]|uniref:MORF/ORRM1/DAG-like MORF domain-containing protein n=1 Tax=Coptis chinensis TaxID=261450 RepID=A0A835HV04_9MAGN|nr:hypothetical protein IFM89_018531 [Coptis chinensis]